MAKLFFSYSHKDEGWRDQLEVHLAGLKRQKLIEAYHDRRITAGRDFGQAIESGMDEADVILLLVSPDFIAAPTMRRFTSTSSIPATPRVFKPSSSRTKIQ